MDPSTCKACHADAYREWAGSMHAYASEDPVFRAMNARGQEETEGRLGSFCVECHAPMAVRDGLTEDGLDLDELGPEYQGVTCYFCHNVEALEEGHDSANNPLVLANDNVMRAALEDPARSPAHRVAYSALHDGDRIESSQLCGTCHDIKTPAGVHLERTLAEWESSVFSGGADPSTCNECHMPTRQGVAAQVDGITVPARRVHSHAFPGVDTALTSFPDIEIQKAAISCDLSAAVRAVLVPSPSGEFTLWLESSIGHGWPSGAAQDRRAWVEFTAYDADGVVIFQSGNIRKGEYVVKAEGDPGYDRNLFAMYDRIYGADGEPVHMFWDAAPSETYPTGYESLTLPPLTAPGEKHYREWRYDIGVAPARVTVRLHIRPMDLSLIDDLIASGHLDEEIRERFVDFDVDSAMLDWSQVEDGWDEYSRAEPNPHDCPDDWRCMLYPTYPGCE